MTKEIITFADIEIEQNKFYHRKNLILLEDVDTYKYRNLTWFLLVKKNINILLFTEMRLIKLNHYAKCFQKQVLI